MIEGLPHAFTLATDRLKANVGQVYLMRFYTLHPRKRDGRMIWKLDSLGDTMWSSDTKAFEACRTFALKFNVPWLVDLKANQVFDPVEHMIQTLSLLQEETDDGYSHAYRSSSAQTLLWLIPRVKDRIHD